MDIHANGRSLASDARTSDAFASKRKQQILHLREPSWETGRLSRIARHIQQTSAFSIVSGGAISRRGNRRRMSVSSALAAWREIEAKANSVCLGLIAEPGMAAAAVSCILADGWKGGALPGAIALIGYDQQIVSACLAICTWSQSQGQSQNHTRMTKVGLTDPVAFEWPPLAIFIEADDPSIAECARACRKLRAANVPIRLEIVGPFSNLPAEDLTDAMISEFVSEVDAFFDAHLAADFPKMR